MGVDHPKDQAMIRSLELSAPPPIFERVESGNGVISDHVRKLP